MMSTQSALVTSDQKKGRDAVAKFRFVYDEAQLTPESAQRLNEAKGWKEYLSAGILRFSSGKHPDAEELERFYAEVLGMTVDLRGVMFPEKEGFPVYMALVPGMSEDAVMEKITKHFGVKVYAWQTPVASNIDRTTAQARPEGVYVFVHVGGDEPDAKHLGKSYDDAVEASMVFASPLEYLLMTGFHMWKHRRWMDSKCWIRTSSLWSDGSLMGGCWDPSDGRLYLDFGDRDGRGPGSGPRELFLG